MAKQYKLKCLRCGHEYTITAEGPEADERSCPNCRSNSVRLLKQPE